mmetsp:Transcript_16517/g.45113  ORF Transcript_16517/g.45113 Transcript_16517/m.45113 type:complete len:203 (+) Transcript_16517:822-1430(+)
MAPSSPKRQPFMRRHCKYSAPLTASKTAAAPSWYRGCSDISKLSTRRHEASLKKRAARAAPEGPSRAWERSKERRGARPKNAPPSASSSAKGYRSRSPKGRPVARLWILSPEDPSHNQVRISAEGSTPYRWQAATYLARARCLDRGNSEPPWLESSERATRPAASNQSNLRRSGILSLDPGTAVAKFLLLAVRLGPRQGHLT